MSTTFRVHPSTTSIPSFRDLLERSTAELHRYLEAVDIDARPAIGVEIKANRDHETLPLDLASPATWTRDCYAWFRVGDVLGGTDAYFRPLDEFSESGCRDLPR